jgi:hypothetical protein
LLWGLQVFNTVLAILDFSIFMVNAQNDADALYNVTDPKTYRDWCVSVSNTSMSCIKDKQGDIGMVSDGVRSNEIISGWTTLIVMLGISAVFLMQGRSRDDTR